MDILTSAERSHRMSLIRSKNTKPEIAVRQMLCRSGISGYRLNYDMMGRPDIVFRRKKIAIFVDGCFWHGCSICYTKPINNRKYWELKISRNQERDREVNRKLRALGFKVMRIREHDIARRPAVISRRLEGLKEKMMAS